jgi:hypothetical protein
MEVCAVCQSGFELSNNVCVCLANQYLLNGVCISCKVANCDSCSAPDVC